jgi:hypothetical protein
MDLPAHRETIDAEPEMTRYRKIEVRTWSDDAFRALTPLMPSGQALWFFLLTGPHTGPIPGLYRAGRAAMAEELNWEMDAFTGAFHELETLGMAKADFRARLIWLPNAIKHNKPESPNVVKHWRVEIDLLPECELKRSALVEIRAALAEIGPAFVDAFDEVTGGKLMPKPPPEPTPDPSAATPRKPSPKPSPNASGKGLPKDLLESGTATGTAIATAAAGDPPPPPATQSPDGVGGSVSAAQLSAAMRPYGINANPSQPHLIVLAEQGITPETVRAACEEAKRSKPGEAVSVGYVIGVLKRWAAESQAIAVSGAVRPPLRASPNAAAVRDASRKAAAASIGLGGNHARDDPTIIDLN